MSSLRDQLFKAGLVDKKAKLSAETQARRKRKKKRKQRRDEEEERRRAAYEAELARQAAENRAREEQRRRERERKERDNRIRNLARAWALRQVRKGRRRWYFPLPDGRIGWLDVTAEHAWRLEIGALAVVAVPGDKDEPYALVPRRVAERIEAIAPEFVCFWNRDQAAEVDEQGLSVHPTQMRDLGAGLPRPRQTA